MGLNKDSLKDTPHIKNKLAKEEDLKKGLAIFYINNEVKIHKPMTDISIPSIAILNQENNEDKLKVIVVQGEIVDDRNVIGYRTFEGGEGVCLLEELEFIK